VVLQKYDLIDRTQSWNVNRSAAAHWCGVLLVWRIVAAAPTGNIWRLVMKRQEMAFDPFQLIGRQERKELTRRNDAMGLIYLGRHCAAIGAGGLVIYLTYGSVLMLPAMFAHGIVLACLFAPMHECSHGTAFRTRWLNEAVYRLVSIVYISQPTWYRYRHAVHHTYTQIQGKDPAMVLPGPTTWRHYFEQLLGWRFWTTFPVVVTKHAFGRMRPQDAWYVPKSDLPRIYGEARIMLGIYSLVAAVAVYYGSFAPLIYWLFPRMIGEPLQRSWRIAEHKGCEEGPDVRTNTRSTKASAMMNILCWNMPYHSEHHVLPQAPFFALPKLNNLIGHKMKPMGESLLAVDREVRRTCIVSEDEAAKIIDERKRRNEDTDQSWLCRLD
jgi:fatty acid desaturase